jgi:ferredoxin
MTKIDTGFAEEIKKYGAKDFDACYNCGNCTAVCELTEKNANFPRMLIRYGLLGQKEEILKSKELWLCYSCGDCSDKCPRQASPGDYMSALRRYAIASYEPTGITKLIFKSNFLYIFITLLLSVILGFFLLTLKPEQEVSRWIFDILPYEIIHNIGILIFILTGISIIWGLLTMWFKFQKNVIIKDKKKVPFSKSLMFVINEMGTMKRYRSCDEEENSFWRSKHILLQPWLIHWTIMWGFIGLLIATTLDFIFKDPAIDIWLPARLLGTASGILLVYGTSIALNYRIKKITKAYSDTKLADWMFLSFLWIAGITGFWLEAAVTFDSVIFINHIVLIIHTIISMELVLLFAFSKFAHAVYRPLALFIHHQN